LLKHFFFQRVNDEPPVAATEPLFTEIGGAAIVNNVTFFVSDLDTEPFDLVVTLSEAPKIGEHCYSFLSSDSNLIF